MIFHDKECSPVETIEHARHTYTVTLLYKKNTNTVTLDNSAGTGIRKKIQSTLVKTLESVAKRIVKIEY